MIELNLLPEVKQEYIKAQRIKRLVFSVCVLISIASVTVFVLLFLVESWQKHTLSNVNSDVTSKTSELKGKPHLNEVLTVQNQLSSLNTLHRGEPITTRLFDYLNQVTPSNLTISNLSVDFTANTLNLSGSATNTTSINQFVDTLNFTKYYIGSDKTTLTNAFSSVVLQADSQSNQSDSPFPASYSITTSIDPALFDSSKQISLYIPNQVTTRSTLENPGPLFTQSPTKPSKSGGGQ
ncbi:MAG: PilN domain-containing protein [Candidatus Saccharimonadales bacterium]